MKENQDYKIKLHLMSLQCEAERASFADQLAKEKKKRKKLILLYVIVGMVGGAIIN